MTRVLVCGSRDFNSYRKLRDVLDALHATHAIDTIIEGEAKGADELARFWADHQDPPVTVEKYPADWDQFGKSAGPIRNRAMLFQGKPDFVVAFPSGRLSESKGTRNMVQQARKTKVRVIVVGEDDVSTYPAGVYTIQEDPEPIHGA